ncbi:MAG: ABC transporter permease [Bacteroidales bacterium]
MLRKFFVAFLRNIRKDKVYSLINLLGFTIGISSFMLILLFVTSELSYDRHHANADRIHRLCIRAMIGDTRINQTFSSARMFREMTARFPEIETGTKFMTWSNLAVQYGDRNYAETNVFFADSTLFDVFTIPLVFGTEKYALNRPNTMILSQSCSEKYFGDVNPVGKVLRLVPNPSTQMDFEITGVFRDIPVNSHMHFDMVGSLLSFPNRINNDGWSENGFVTYFLLAPNTSVEALEKKMLDYTKEVFGADRYEQFLAQGNSWEFFLQRVTDIHLRSDLNGEFEPNGNIRNVYIFSIIGLFVLVIACINFMNLATARSAKRAREVGIRKVSGSSRWLLIVQFLFESVILTLVSVLVALLLVKLTLPWFNSWLQLHLGFGLVGFGRMFFISIGAAILLGVLSGLYPALFLSAYKPIRVLKAQTIPSRGGIGLRNALVIFQFAATVFLIIGTLMVNRQMRFLQKTDIGFTRENVLVITDQPEFTNQYESFRTELMKNPLVINVTASRALPGYHFSNWGFRAEGVDQGFTLNIMASDENLDDVLELDLVKGRFFSEEFPADTAAIILNETAVRVLGMDDPLGRVVFSNSHQDIKYPVIGIVRDFHYESMHSEVRPMAILHRQGPVFRSFSLIAVKFKEGAAPEVADLSRRTWDRLAPGTPYLYTYLDDHYNSLYHNEKQTAQVFVFLAVLAILVACLGLLGLAAFLTQQKTRQIAVRKVFGATNGQIINLLTYRFVRWVLLSIIIAGPLAWWLMMAWLNNFVYKATMAWWIYVLSGLVALVIAIVTVTFVTFKAARANPAVSLKYE